MARDPYHGMNSSFSERLKALIAAAPGKITITSGYRSTQQQAALYAKKPNLAAPPGKSRHEHGLAADLAYESPAVRAWAHANAPRFGLRFPMLNPKGKKYEPWHVELAGSAAAHKQAPAPATVGAPEIDEYEEDRHSLEYQLSSFIGIMDDPMSFLTDEAA